MIEVSRTCNLKSGLCVADSIIGSPFYLPILIYQFGFRPQSSFRISKIENDTSIDFTSVEASVYDSISKQMKWSTNELDWFTFVDEDTSSRSAINVNFWLLSKKELNMNIMANQSVILQDANKNFIESYTKGNLVLSVRLDNVDYTNKEMNTCEDSLCENKISEYKAPENFLNSGFKFRADFKILFLLFIFIGLF